MKLPSFESLKPNYPTTHDPAEVLLGIGGQIGNLAPTTNTCVMRMSKAFNYAGKSFAIPGNDPKLRTLRGKDHMHYAYNVQDFLKFLAAHYGPPSISRKYAKNEKESSAPFLGKTGIIAWHIEGWTDATGHFTLWDGKTGLYEGEHDYFESFPFTVGTHVVRETQADLWTC